MRNKAFAIESIAVLLLLVIFAVTVFIVVGAGAGTFDTIINEKKSTETARVACSYINMKIRQNDAAAMIDVVQTDFGNALRIEMEGADLYTYIFYSDGMLYECVTKKDTQPKVEAANAISRLLGFDIRRENNSFHLSFISDSGGQTQTVTAVVGQRT